MKQNMKQKAILLLICTAIVVIVGMLGAKNESALFGAILAAGFYIIDLINNGKDT